MQGTKSNRASCSRWIAPTGKPVWNAPLGRALDQDRGGGPRGTPTVEGESFTCLT